MENDREQPVYTMMQLSKVQKVYEALAQLLPTEGRDYRVNFAFNDPNDQNAMSLSFTPYTEIGKLWCDYATRALHKLWGGK